MLISSSVLVTVRSAELLNETDKTIVSTLQLQGARYRWSAFDICDICRKQQVPVRKKKGDRKRCSFSAFAAPCVSACHQPQDTFATFEARANLAREDLEFELKFLGGRLFIYTVVHWFTNWRNPFNVVKSPLSDTAFCFDHKVRGSQRHGNCDKSQTGSETKQAFFLSPIHNRSLTPMRNKCCFSRRVKDLLQ